MIELLNIDCMEYMKTLPDKAFDLAIVDPPYGIGINVSIGRRKGDAKSNYKKFAGEDKNIPSEDYFLRLDRVSKNQIIWGGNYMTEFLYPSPCWILWDKGFSEDVTFAQYEMAWSSFKSSAKKYDFNAAANKDRIHPTQKPVKLYEWLLRNYAKPGQRILDTHLGSGSSAIAAHYFGCDFVGCEIDTDYFNAAKERFDR
ncbi:MAG TPA: DNA methyltransferase, partial [Anaerolineaceae bacterium]|nr:DNA methyltransferase [Anaerolineaceae bacterium]